LRESAVSCALLSNRLWAAHGWALNVTGATNVRTLRNFPMQSIGAEILHVACVPAERRGIRIVAPVHDAIMVEAPAEHGDEISAELNRVMRDAASTILRGYELPTDVQMVGPGQCYFDERGEQMWGTVNKLVAKLEEQRA